VQALFALIACSAFVTFLIRLEHRRSPDLSKALWIPAIWFTSVSTKTLGTWFKTGGDIESGSALDRIFLIVLLSICLVILSKRKFDWSKAIRKNPWPILIILYMLISVVWSGMPAISFRRWFREIIAIPMAFVVLSEKNPRLALQSIFRRAIYILIPFSIVLIKYFPEFGRAYGRWSGEVMWIGMAYQKNGLALQCSFSIIFFVCALIQRREKNEQAATKYMRYLDILLLLLSLYILGGPSHTLKHSAASSICLIIALLALGGLLWGKKRGKIIGAASMKILALIIFIYGTITPFLGRLAIFDISSYFGRAETLTGRADEIWVAAIPYALQKLPLGHGFGGFWTTSMRGLIASDAHNGYLDAILDLGIVGLVLTAFYLFNCFSRAIKVMAFDFYWGALFICYLIMVLINNIAESFIHGYTRILLAAILFFYVVSNRIGEIEKEETSAPE